MADREATGPGGKSDLTAKQEAFALAYFETGNAAEAYRRAYDVTGRAGDSWVYVEACQLLNHPKIAPRIKELQEQAAILSIFTRQKALEEYEEARIAAKKLGMAAAMVSATSGKVKLFGLDQPTRFEHGGIGGGPIQTQEVSPLERINGRIAGIAARSRPDSDTGGTD